MGRPKARGHWFFPGQIERGCISNHCGRDKTDTEERQCTRRFPEADRLTRHLRGLVYPGRGWQSRKNRLAIGDCQLPNGGSGGSCDSRAKCRLGPNFGLFWAFQSANRPPSGQTASSRCGIPLGGWTPPRRIRRLRPGAVRGSASGSAICISLRLGRKGLVGMRGELDVEEGFGGC
jgi:hypothetical protein